MLDFKPADCVILILCYKLRLLQLITRMHNQFGFKKGVSCSSAICSIRSIVYNLLLVAQPSIFA